MEGKRGVVTIDYLNGEAGLKDVIAYYFLVRGEMEKGARWLD